MDQLMDQFGARLMFWVLLLPGLLVALLLVGFWKSIVDSVEKYAERLRHSAASPARRFLLQFAAYSLAVIAVMAGLAGWIFALALISTLLE